MKVRLISKRDDNRLQMSPPHVALMQSDAISDADALVLVADGDYVEFAATDLTGGPYALTELIVLFDRVRFPIKIYHPLEDSSLSIRVLSEKKLSLEVDHGEAQFPRGSRPCRAVCGDGKTGQPCVTCRSQGLSVRVCC